MYFPFIKYRRIFYIFSGTLVTLSLVSIIIFGLKFGIDFTGGSVLGIKYEQQAPSFTQIKTALQPLKLGTITLKKDGENGVILRMKNISESTHEAVMEKLQNLGKLEKGSSNFENIGPIVGNELKQKTKFVVLLCIISIILYVAFAFRRVSKPVNSFIYGFTSLVALGHDIIIPLGVFSLLGELYGVQVTVPVITALLTVFGYSINDSVVVFDRVRENILKSQEPTFDLVVDKSLNQTITRSLNTSLTTLIVLFSIFFFGGVTLRYFSLALILGISFGTYSSLFLATPLLVSYLKRKERKMQS